MADIVETLLNQVAVDPELLRTRRVVVGCDTVAPPRHAYQVRFPRLEFVLSGVYHNALSNQTGEVVERGLGTGDCLFVPPNSWNRVIWIDDIAGFSLLFGPRQLGMSHFAWTRATGTFSQVTTRACPLPASSPLYSIVRALGEFPGDHDETAADIRLLAQTVIEYALRLLSHPSAQEPSRARHLFDSICLYVEENYTQTINRDMVAEQFNVSPNYLSKLFRTHGQGGFTEYVVSVRLERARFMLRHAPLHLDEIARGCGFHDPNYFCRVFKNRFGRTPTEYRRS